MVYCCLKILELGNLKKWKLGIVLCGFLSIYTIPTNSFFVFGLACWVLTILLVSGLKKEFTLLEENSTKAWIGFGSCFLAIGMLTIVVYLPVKDEILEVAKYDINFSKKTYDNEDNTVLLGLNAIKHIFLLIFEGPIKFFIPLIIVGWRHYTSPKKSYRLLPLAILFFPLLIVCISGVSGHTRNYLCNFPILIIFMAAGLIAVFDYLNKLLYKTRYIKYISYFPVIFYLSLSLKIILFHQIPQFTYYSGKPYKEALQSKTNPNELILISSSRYYLYSRAIIRNNLNEIFQKNKLSGMKWIGKDFDELIGFTGVDPVGQLPLFFGLYNEKNAEGEFA